VTDEVQLIDLNVSTRPTYSNICYRNGGMDAAC